LPAADVGDHPIDLLGRQSAFVKPAQHARATTPRSDDGPQIVVAGNCQRVLVTQRRRQELPGTVDPLEHLRNTDDGSDAIRPVTGRAVHFVERLTADGFRVQGLRQRRVGGRG